MWIEVVYSLNRYKPRALVELVLLVGLVLFFWVIPFRLVLFSCFVKGLSPFRVTGYRITISVADNVDACGQGFDRGLRLRLRSTRVPVTV